MGIMTVSAEQIGSLAGSHKISRPLSVDTCPPVLVNVAVAFAAEPMAFGKIDELSVIETEFISVFCIVAVEAPSHCLCMMHPDFRMFVFQFSFLTVCSHGGMTGTAGEDSLGKRRRRDRKILACFNSN